MLYSGAQSSSYSYCTNASNFTRYTHIFCCYGYKQRLFIPNIFTAPLLAVLNVVRSKFVELSHVFIWVEYAMRIEDSRWSCDLDEMSLGDGLSHPNPLGGLKSGRFIRIRQDEPPTHFNPLFHRDPRRKHLL